MSATVHQLPRVALTREEAAESLGISLDSFEQHVQNEIAVVRLGRRILVPIGELETWVAKNAERILGGAA